jgi:hypothetical protein
MITATSAAAQPVHFRSFQQGQRLQHHQLHLLISLAEWRTVSGPDSPRHREMGALRRRVRSQGVPA